MIRSATILDSESLSKIHIESLADSFLASLGENFLSNLYAFIIQKETVFVYEDAGELFGFISFSKNSSGMMKKFMFSCPKCILYLAIKMVIQPNLLIRFFETFKAPYKTQINSKLNEQRDIPLGELLSIAVSPRCQALGIGGQLLNTLETYLILNKISSYKVIAGENLSSANRFYLKNGFKLVEQIVIHKKERSNVYLKKIIP